MSYFLTQRGPPKIFVELDFGDLSIIFSKFISIPQMFIGFLLRDTSPAHGRQTGGQLMPSGVITLSKSLQYFLGRLPFSMTRRMIQRLPARCQGGTFQAESLTSAGLVHPVQGSRGSGGGRRGTRLGRQVGSRRAFDTRLRSRE